MGNNSFVPFSYYCEHGFSIFPVYWLVGKSCSCGSSSCKSPGKHPLVSRGFKDATTDIAVIQNWLQKWPLANWGMRTGDATSGGSGVVVVDIDAKSSGLENWEMLREEHPEPIETVSVSTGGAGLHLWFLYPDGLDIRSSASVLSPGIDIRANDGYVLVPPSKTIQEYQFILDPREIAIEPCPDWIVSRLINKAIAKQYPVGDRIGLEVHQGARHQTVLSMAGAMRRIGMTPVEMMASLLAVRDHRFDSGNHLVTDDEIEDVITWVNQKHRYYPLTDLGNAERFIELFGSKVRFCYELDSWFVWDGRRWKDRADAELMKMAHTAVRSMFIEASNIDESDARRELIRHAILSESYFKVENMIRSAKPYLAVRVDELDKHPMLLNTLNGVIDLSSGQLLPHDPQYLLTKIIEVPYDPAARSPEWEKFIDLVTLNDQGLQVFLQLAMGYSLTGRIDEHCLFFLYGTGANGKTTFVETIRLLLNGYAHKVNIESLMQSFGSSNAATPDIASMLGARFILSSEIPENRKLNESLVKELTGGDTITARQLYQNPFSFTPSHKLWLSGNYKPRVIGTDEGIWRRIKIVPFRYTFTKDKRKPMSEVLEAFKQESPGILTWMVKGCLEWQIHGLVTPVAVEDATAEYRSDQDLIQQFLAEKCEVGNGYSIEKDVLYKTWRDWCESVGEKEAARQSKKWLTHQMTNRGFTHGGGQNSSLEGIRLG